MDDAAKQAILSAVRSILIAVGSALAARGVLDSETINTIIGAVMIALPMLWGIWSKYQSERNSKAREAVAVNVGIAVADATTGKTPLVTAENAPNVILLIAPTLSAGPIEPQPKEENKP